MKHLILSALFSILFLFNLTGQNSETTESFCQIYKQYKEYSLTDTILIKEYIKIAQEKVDSCSDLETAFCLNLFLGTYFNRELEYEKAIAHYYKALNVAKQFDKRKEALIYDRLANVYKIFGNDKLIIECVDNAIDLKREIGDSTGIHRSRLILCKYYRNSGNNLNAFKIAFKALEYGETVNDSGLIATSNNNIGLAYKDIKEYDKSLTYLDESYEIYQNLGNRSGSAVLLNSIGIVYLKKKEYQEALKYFNRSLKIEEELNRKNAIYRMYNNIGLAYSFLGNNDAAIELFNKCINMYSFTDDNIKLANLYNSIGTSYAQKFEIDSAIYYQNLSLELSERNGYEKLHQSSTLALSRLYEELGNIDKAYENMKKYGEMNTKLEEYNEDIHMLSAEFEYIMAKNKKIRQIEAENKILWYTIYFISLSVILLLSIILVRRYYKKYNTSKRSIITLEKKIETLNKNNDQKDKELASKLLQLINHNTEKEYLVNKLNGIKLNVSVKLKSQIQELINEINLKIDKDLWNEFEVRFTNIHSDFYCKLLAQNPSLTQGEKRLCSLLYLNFSPKEISLITKQSYRGILVAKYRLKNKLQLSNSDELTNFLNQLN